VWRWTVCTSLRSTALLVVVLSAAGSIHKADTMNGRGQKKMPAGKISAVGAFGFAFDVTDYVRVCSFW
jgi:hypothetical protein